MRVPGPAAGTVQELRYRGRPCREQGPYLVLADVVLPEAGDKGTDLPLRGEQFLRRDTIVNLQGPDA